MTQNMIDDGLPEKVTTCGLAITAFVLSLLGYCCCLGPISGVPGAICGHIALTRIRNSGGALGGSGLALASVIMGWISFVVVIAWFLLTALLLPAVASAREQARLATSRNNTRCLAAACLQYAEQHDGMLPDSFDNLVEAELIDSSALRSPFGPEDSPCGYELVLRGKIESYESPGTTPLIRDLYTGKRGQRAIAYLDGSLTDIQE